MNREARALLSRAGVGTVTLRGQGARERNIGKKETKKSFVIFLSKPKILIKSLYKKFCMDYEFPTETAVPTRTCPLQGCQMAHLCAKYIRFGVLLKLWHIVVYWYFFGIFS